MAKPQITITLGRSGQRVVKDSWEGSDGICASVSAPSLSKRMPESFGSGVDHAFDNNKRMRNDTSGRSYGYSCPLDGKDSRLDPKDLRSKLTQKRISRELELEKHERNKMELYEKVSKAIRSVERPDDKLLRSTSREAAETPKVGLITSVFPSLPSNESPDHKLCRSTPSTREAAETPKVCDISSPFAPWPSHGQGTRFSERISISSSGISTPRTAIDELPQLNRMKGYSSTPLGSSRSNVPMPTDLRRPLDSGKLVTEFPLAAGGMSLPPPLQSLHVPKESQPLTVSSLLHSLGLGKYYINFQAEEIDMAVLKQMGEGDLKELGIPMGPRKKIFLAVQQARTKRPVTQPPSN
ncbi:hypothetical protein ACS0TY_028285 [Phlomoides rotata]